MVHSQIWCREPSAPLLAFVTLGSPIRQTLAEADQAAAGLGTLQGVRVVTQYVRNAQVRVPLD